MTVALQLNGHGKDLGGGFMVRRLLPSAPRQAVGPFLFFDHFGPVTIHPESNFDVRPHPHIGLATVTYLFEGAMMHRDSLGTVQRIEPGAINWMTAGRGIVHSERRPEDLGAQPYVSHGLQLWAALPATHEEVAPSFSHTPAAQIPEIEMDGAQVRVLIGEAFGQRSPVPTFMPTVYLDVRLPEQGGLDLPQLAEELAIYAVDGEVLIDGELLPAQNMAILNRAAVTRLQAYAPVQLMVLGGAALDAHRHIFWNFVSSRKDRIAQAAADWEAQQMGQVPGETETIPLPPRRPPAA